MGCPQLSPTGNLMHHNEDQTKNDYGNSSNLRYRCREGILYLLKIAVRASGGHRRGKILMFELVSYRQATSFLYHKFQVIGVISMVGNVVRTLRSIFKLAALAQSNVEITGRTPRAFSPGAHDNC
ncbi:hypothetical protein TcasGA2_TC003012 [Tribolium castaneum]|uniref:Uncharacterized protein n=1 Tax=Tribolium castaneum TaxID=7070 RepID=D6WG86_TRICA|nr:hypothetical protein TcasGA2_TC003012 [Tribolium castaneum]